MVDNAEQIHQHVAEVLSQFSHVTLSKSLVELKALHYCAVLDHVLYIELMLPFVWHEAFEQLKIDKTDQLKTTLNVQNVVWKLHHKIATLARANNQPQIGSIKNIIAVSSGKGGVGKSSTAVNLALALSHLDVKVGLLDADIYGPSIPVMLGTANQRPTSPDGAHMQPVEVYGLSTNSIGYLVSDEGAMVWRGPMASKALLQLLQDTVWGELDYLVLDMPPGTGDIQLTLAQSIPVTGTVVVTTPQDVALQDAMKGVIMFEKVNVPIIGIVENMSVHICSHCGHQEAIFGSGGAEKLAKQRQLTLLGKMPLHISLREDLDKGVPTVIGQPESEFSHLYRQLAETISAKMYWQNLVIPDEIAIKSVN